MKKIKILWLTILFLCATVFSTEAQDSSLSNIEQHLLELIDEGDLVGVFAAHVSKDGETKALAIGILSQELKTSVDEHTLFEIGSITKIFTTLALARVMEEQGLELDTEAEKLLPDDFELPVYEEQSITLQHLVTHTSGLPSLPDNFYPEDGSNPYADYTVAQMKEYLRSTTLQQAPGSKFGYSNLGMGLAGHIIAHQTGTSYLEVIEEYILDPLNMNSTTVAIAAEDSNRLARGHHNKEQVSNWDLPAFEAAGALRSSGSDMITFLKVQMGLQETELDPYILQLQQPLFDIEQGLSQQMDAIGMGWFYATGQDTVIWHSGGTGGYRTFMGINKETGEGALILSNATTDISDIYFHLLDEQYPLRRSQEIVELTEKQLQRLVGEYRSPMGVSFYVTAEEGELYIRLTGQPKGLVQPQSPTVFVNNQVAAVFEFDTTSTGEISGLELRQGGQTIPAEKVSNEVEEPPERQEITVDDEILKRYTGTYQLAPGMNMRITHNDGQLRAQVTGQGGFPIYAETETRFFYKVVEAEIEFIEDEDGNYSKLILYQVGQQIEGQKVSEE